MKKSSSLLPTKFTREALDTQKKIDAGYAVQARVRAEAQKWVDENHPIKRGAVIVRKREGFVPLYYLVLEVGADPHNEKRSIYYRVVSCTSAGLRRSRGGYGITCGADDAEYKVHRAAR